MIKAAGVSYAGRPRLSIRLMSSPMSSLVYLTHAFDLSDEAHVQHWSENVVWQHFSGLDYYELPLLPDFVVPNLGIYAVYPSRRAMSAKLRAFVHFAAVNFTAHPTRDAWMH